jgi:ribosomal-protein-alanine N-acetyltransferase
LSLNDRSVLRVPLKTARLTLQGAIVSLEEFSEQDLEAQAYYRWLRDPEVVMTICRLEYLLPLSAEAIQDYARTLMRSDRDAFFSIVLKENDAFIGTLRIGHIDWRTGEADIGILIGEKSYWGKGVATDAICTACRYAFDTLSLRRLTAGTTASNLAMCRCFTRLGFQLEGRLRGKDLIRREYVDHLLYSVFRDELRRSDAPAVPES